LETNEPGVEHVDEDPPRRALMLQGEPAVKLVANKSPAAAAFLRGLRARGGA